MATKRKNRQGRSGNPALAGYTAAGPTDVQLLEAVKQLAEHKRVDQAYINEHIHYLRVMGVSYARIAAAAGVSTQTVHKRFRDVVPVLR
jgi:DNA-directed RNA polymerase specialized sigma24 family protein